MNSVTKLASHPVKVVVAYLAPEIPALSATFVYEELLALERRGVSVFPVSVHNPFKPAKGQEALSSRCFTLYGSSKLAIALRGLWRIPAMPGAVKAIRWLLQDLASLGFSKQSPKLAFQFLAGANLAIALRREGVAHLHIHFAHVPTQIGMYAAAMAGIPFTVMSHANDIFERGLLLKEKAQRASKFLTISAFNLQYLRSLGLPADKLAVVRCGVSFKPPAAWPTYSTKSTYSIGTLGRLVEKKGVDLLLQAMVGLPHVRLSVAGDGPLLAELKALADQLGVAASVDFVGALPHDEVAAWMSGLDAFVLACKKDQNGDMDGIPVVLMEAMSQAIPVISTHISGIPELVLDRQTGLLAAPIAPDLRDKIQALLESPALRERLANKAVQHVQQEFGQEVNVNRLLEHFGAGRL